MTVHEGSPGRTYSVVIATYERRDLVLECVKSVAQQTLKPHEIIVVSDGGGDATASAVRTAFPDVIVIEQPNLGRSIASNRGAARATGSWICFLDDDDLWHEEKLSAVDRYLDENPDCAAVNHPVWFFSGAQHESDNAYGFEIDFTADSVDECHRAVRDGDPSRNDWTYLDINGRSHEMLLERNRGALSASVIRRDVLHTAGGFDVHLTSADDWLLFLSIAKVTEWHTVPRRLAFCRQHSAQSTGDIENTVAILAAFNLVWRGGRPLTERADRETIDRRRDGYRGEYRWMVRHYIWAAIRARRWDLVPLLRAAARPLLRRRRDRLLVLVPPKVVCWMSAKR